MSPFKTKDTKYWISKGQEALEKRNFDEAISDYTKVVELNPSYIKLVAMGTTLPIFSPDSFIK